jgi:hypothetical protein
VAGCCEYGDEPSGSGATDLVNVSVSYHKSIVLSKQMLFWNNQY